MFNIPLEWQEINERLAAEIADVPRSTFRRKHLDKNSAEPISFKIIGGSKHIRFEDLFQIYGEKTLQNLNKMINSNKEEQMINVSLDEYVKTTSDLASKEAEIIQMQIRIKEYQQLLEESKQREEENLQKVVNIMQNSQKLLEQKLLEPKGIIKKIKMLMNG